MVITDGQVWVRVTESMQAEFPIDKVHLQVLHTIPTAEQVALIVDGLDPRLVTALMGEYSAVGAMDDPMGMFAQQAIAAALRGERPGGKTPPDETLG